MNLLQLPQFSSQAAFDLFLAKYFAGSPEAFYQEMNKLSDQLIRSDLTKAQLLTQKTIGLKRFMPPKYRGHFYRIWGRHYHLSGDYAQARRLYDKAIVEFNRDHDGNNRARVQKALLDVLMYLGRYSEGLDAGRQSLKYYQRHRCEVDAAQVRTNMGNLYHRLDQNRKALFYYDRAYKVFKKQKGSYPLALIQFNRANIFSNLNELTEAEKLYRQAAEIYRPLGMELAAVQAEYSLAYISFLKGSFSQSLRAFSSAGEKFKRLGDCRGRALTKLDRIEVYLHLNLFSQAIADAPEVADAFAALKMHYEQGKAIYFEAAGYFAFGNYAKATELVHRAFRLFGREKNETWMTLCRFMLARIDARDGRTTKALRVLEEIASIHKRQGDERRHFDTILVRLAILIESRAYQIAGALIHAINPKVKNMAGYQRYLFLLLCGNMSRQRNETERAEYYYRQAISVAQKLQASIVPDEIRRFFWMDKLTAFTQLAAIYLDKGQKRRALNVLESGRVILTLISRPTCWESKTVKMPLQFEAEKRNLKAFLLKTMMPVGSESRVIAMPGRIRSAELRLWNLERVQRAEIPSSLAAVESTSDPLEALQHRLDENDIVIRYVCRESMCGAYVITRGTVGYHPFTTTCQEIYALLSRLYFLTTQTGDSVHDEEIINALVGEISRRIWQPLERVVTGCDDPYVITDGILDRLPFNALLNRDGSRIFQRLLPRIIVGLPGGADSDRRHSHFSKCFILLPAVSKLPGGVREGTAINHYMPAAITHSGSDVNGEKLTECLEVSNGLVHLITHAAQSYENHLFSTILLGDGPFYPFDLYTRPVRSRLVVLSGCQTGDPGLSYSSDSISLAHSFLSAGAQEVLASYWPISDSATCQLMEAFYKNIARGTSFASALRNAMSELYASTAGFRHWAGFYLIRQS